MLKRYRVVTGPLRMGAGEIIGGLSEAQLNDRRHVIAKNKDGTVTLLQPCDFKVGEEFSYGGKLPRSAEHVVAEGEAPETIHNQRIEQERKDREARQSASLKEFTERGKRSARTAS